MNALHILQYDLIQNVFNGYLDYYESADIISSLTGVKLKIEPHLQIFETYYIQSETIATHIVLIDFKTLLDMTIYETDGSIITDVKLDFTTLLYTDKTYRNSILCRSEIIKINSHNFMRLRSGYTLEHITYFSADQIKAIYKYDPESQTGFFKEYLKDGTLYADYIFRHIQNPNIVYMFMLNPFFTDLKCDGTRINYSFREDKTCCRIQNYRNGVLDGDAYLCDTYNYVENKIYTITIKCNYSNGLKNGIEYKYVNKVIASKFTYVNGIQNGPYELYTNGKLYQSGIYRNGIIDKIVYHSTNKVVSKILRLLNI